MPSAVQENAINGHPLYRRIQDALREQIAQGRWNMGEALPSRRVLCSEFSTTRVTLDKAIQGLVHEGILSASVGSGTYVAEPALAFRAAPKTLRIGVIAGGEVPEEGSEEGEAANFYFGPLFQGIRDGFSGQAVEVVYDHLPSRDYLRLCRDKTLNALVLVTPSLEALPALRTLGEAEVPYVAVGISSDTPSETEICSVDTDNIQGASDSVRHLLALGHRRIALVNLAMSHANHHDRLEGYCRTLAAAGLAIAPDDLVMQPNYASVHFEECMNAWVARVLAQGSMPTAIFACDYQMTLATLRALRQHGLRVPEDVSVVGFDDPISAGHLTPPLTTVRQPVYRMGRRAAERLLMGLRAGKAPQGIELLPTELIVRESTGIPAAADRLRVAAPA